MITSIKKLTTLFLLAAVVGFTACDDDDSTGPNNDLNALETIESESQLSTFYDFLSEEDWADTLSQEGPVTVFAPTDDALEEAEADTLSDEALTDLLQYHVVEENLTYEELQDTESATALNEGTLSFSTDDDEVVTINEDQATITSSGIEATNGTVFVIDTVLTQPEE